jgi:hypothetical protein
MASPSTIAARIRTSVVRTIEVVKYVGQILGFNACAAVGDTQLYLVTNRCVELDGSNLWGIAQGVFKQVLQNSHHAPLVNENVGDGIWGVEGQPYPGNNQLVSMVDLFQQCGRLLFFNKKDFTTNLSMITFNVSTMSRYNCKKTDTLLT